MRVFHFSKAVTILFFSCLLFPFLTFFCVCAASLCLSWYNRLWAEQRGDRWSADNLTRLDDVGAIKAFHKCQSICSLLWVLFSIKSLHLAAGFFFWCILWPLISPDPLLASTLWTRGSHYLAGDAFTGRAGCGPRTYFHWWPHTKWRKGAVLSHWTGESLWKYSFNGQNPLFWRWPVLGSCLESLVQTGGRNPVNHSTHILASHQLRLVYHLGG